tara:strand:- start:225 stop:350 length:126 start_codon:yes stop_codon:yes gene_type:complete
VLHIHGELYLKKLRDGEKNDEEFWEWWDSLSDHDKDQVVGK